MAFTLDVKSEAEVKAWQERARALNARADRAIRDAMDVLKTMPNVATGNFFNEVVKLGNEVCNGMTKILDGMDELFNVVTSFISLIKDTIQKLFTSAQDTAKRIGANG